MSHGLFPDRDPPRIPRREQLSVTETATRLLLGFVALGLLATCRKCGTTFRPRRVDALFCSGRCRQAAYRQRGAV